MFDNQVGIKPNKVQDRYSYAFLNSVCYTENCYSCQFANQARVADVSLGDSWGSTLSSDEQNRGISLILSQNSKGEDLLHMADLHLEDVDIENAIAHNEQLNTPSKKPAEYDTFFKELKRTNNFSKTVKKCYPRFCLRQDIKSILIKTKFFRKS